MDPLFLSQFAQQAQQRMHMVAMGKQAMREAETLNQRRELLASAQEEASQILQEAFAFPQRALVRLQLLISNLNYSGVIPDSFEEKQEKEEVVLLWRKLSNLQGKLTSQLNAEQQAQCQECLEAIGMLFYIETITRPLQAYQEYQQLKPIWNRTWRNTKIAAILSSAFVVLSCSIIMVVIVSLPSTPKYGVNVTIMVGLISSLVAFFMLFLFWDFNIPLQEDIKSFAQVYRQLAEEAHVDDQEFWNVVRDKFEGIPTVEQLQGKWDEQEAKVRLIFGDSPISPSSAQSEVSPSDR